MSQFFPRIKPRKICDNIDPYDWCDARRKAASEGVFFWDNAREGYVNLRLDGVYGIPVLLDGCSFCGGLLPGAKARKAWDEKELAKIDKEISEKRGLGDATAFCEDDDGN